MTGRAMWKTQREHDHCAERRKTKGKITRNRDIGIAERDRICDTHHQHCQSPGCGDEQVGTP